MLKYLFVAQFKDGSIYCQDQEDRSILSSGSGSAFTDIEKRLDDLSTFGLYCPDTEYNVSVNLETGKFDINGFEIYNTDTDIDIPEGTKYRLIYFRRNTISITNDVEERNTKYFIGWQVTVDGKNYKRVIGVE